MDDFNQIYGGLKSEEDKKYLELKAKNDVDGLIALLSLCRDNEHALGRQIIDTLGGRRVVQAVDTLISILNDVNDHCLRHDAARALAQICDRRAVEPLISALGDDDGRLRIVAAEALGDIRDTRAVEPLIAKLDDDFAIYRNDTEYDTIDTTVHRTAAASLQKITSQNFGKDATAWQQWWAKVETPQSSQNTHTQSKKMGCQPWLAGISILIGVLLSILGLCLGFVTIYAQTSGTSGDPENMKSILIALSPLAIGLALVGFGIYTLRNKRKIMVSKN